MKTSIKKIYVIISGCPSTPKTQCNVFSSSLLTSLKCNYKSKIKVMKKALKVRKKN